jgi:flagellar biosynthesis protein FlhG
VGQPGNGAAGPQGFSRSVPEGARPVRVVAVTGGKGGVGKTSVAVNLGVALAQRGHAVMLLDADLGLANVDLMLGLRPRWTLADVVSGERSLAEVVISGPAGLRVVPGASGSMGMADLPAAVHGGLIRAFGEFSADLDVLLVDTAAGVSGGVLSFARAAQELIVVVCDEPTSIADAYALIRLLSQSGVRRFQALANMTREPHEGPALAARLSAVCERYLDVVIDYLGEVPHDDAVRRAVQQRRAVVDLYPTSAAGQAFASLAGRVDAWPVPNLPAGHVQFFFERLLGAALAPREFA